MPTFVVVWSALAFAAYTGYLGLAPWLRRRPVRVTPTSAVVSLVVSLGPGLVYLVVQGAGGGQGVSNPGLVAVAVFGGGLAVFVTAWRGTHVVHGTTAGDLTRSLAGGARAPGSRVRAARGRERPGGTRRPHRLSRPGRARVAPWDVTVRCVCFRFLDGDALDVEICDYH